MADATIGESEEKLSINSASTSNQEKKMENKSDQKVLLKNNEDVDNQTHQQEQQVTLLSEIEDNRAEYNETSTVKSRSKRNVIRVPIKDGYLDEEGNMVDESRIFD
ncbi:hypothetical protein ILUMI_23804 [Ignelater luminosus]|uniref:Uncharacterized protein n=1 Tax=Ignelater luminosus TaxID=2038154 RepID=A0A8K0C873_IGNLU|nr:hypothetical protein ILUMI_23804 [Ignelater luminosus]